MNSVFILGAGASAHANVPMMGTFLEVVEDIARAPGAVPSDEVHRAFKLVVEGRSQLQSVLAKARFDIRNLEAVFAAFEMAELFGELGSLKDSEVAKLTSAMRAVIVTTIESRMYFPVWSNVYVRPTSDYNQLGAILGLMTERGESLSVITFNYDIGVDVGLSVDGFMIDYCLDDQPQIADSGRNIIELMKLHGSINWAVCSQCSVIVPEQAYDVVNNREIKLRQSGTSIDRLTLHPSHQLPQLRHCAQPCQPEPMIVPPTADKGGLRRAIQPVWKRAAQRLRNADNIFVIGYSWPETDHFFHQLYALGTVGSRVLRRFWIFDPDDSVARKFEARLLGQQAVEVIGPPEKIRTSPPGFREPGFREALHLISREFEINGQVIANRANRKN